MASNDSYTLVSADFSPKKYYFVLLRLVASELPSVAIEFKLYFFYLQALINYYCREKYYRHLQNTCLESLQKYGNDPVLIFWKAFGILMEGKFMNDF